MLVARTARSSRMLGLATPGVQTQSVLRVLRVPRMVVTANGELVDILRRAQRSRMYRFELSAERATPNSRTNVAEVPVALSAVPTAVALPASVVTAPVETETLRVVMPTLVPVLVMFRSAKESVSGPSKALPLGPSSRAAPPVAAIEPAVAPRP